MDTATYERLPSQPEGTVLDGTYRLGRRVGFGGMGEVYEATHVRLPGRFALKILLPELLANREAFARFCREAEIMSELRHPNIVQIFDFNASPDGRPYFVMEFLDGRDLEARLSTSGALPLPAVVRIVDAVASALETAHGHGVVHRDLKPANIFLGTVDGIDDELIKVLDFGISQVRVNDRRLSQPNHVLGTPPYMAPEQVRGLRESVDGRADQFALGAIAYRMLTGHEAFGGDDTPALLYQIVHEDPAPLAEHLPHHWDTRALQAVLDRALAKQPDQRWSGMMELARAFEDAAERTLAATAAAVHPRAAPLEISDEPPPIRSPARPAPEPIRSPARPVLEPIQPREPPAAEATQLPPRATAQSPVEPAPVARSSVAPARRGQAPPAWDLPSEVDRVPLTRLRAATLGAIGLGLAAVLVATGWYAQVPAAIPFARRNLWAWISHPATLEQPAADQTVPEVVERAQAKAAEEARGEATLGGSPPAAANAPASSDAPRPARAATRGAHHHRVPAPVASQSTPGSAASPSSSEAAAAPVSRSTLTGAPPNPTPLPSPTAPSSGAASPAPLSAPAPGGFSIPPPAAQAPARDLAPPPDPDESGPPARSNREPQATTPPASNQDDQLPPSRSNTEAPASSPPP